MRINRKLVLVLSILIIMLALSPLFVHLMGEPAATEAPAGASNWATYQHLLVNVPHWMLELTIEVITGILIYPVARWIWSRAKSDAISSHDAQYHEHDAH